MLLSGSFFFVFWLPWTNRKRVNARARGGWQRLKSTIWYTVQKITAEECKQLGVTASPEYAAALTELVFNQIGMPFFPSLFSNTHSGSLPCIHANAISFFWIISTSDTRLWSGIICKVSLATAGAWLFFFFFFIWPSLLIDAIFVQACETEDDHHRGHEDGLPKEYRFARGHRWLHQETFRGVSEWVGFVDHLTAYLE